VDLIEAGGGKEKFLITGDGKGGEEDGLYQIKVPEATPYNRCSHSLRDEKEEKEKGRKKGEKNCKNHLLTQVNGISSRN